MTSFSKLITKIQCRMCGESDCRMTKCECCKKIFCMDCKDTVFVSGGKKCFWCKSKKYESKKK